MLVQPPTSDCQRKSGWTLLVKKCRIQEAPLEIAPHCNSFPPAWNASLGSSMCTEASWLSLFLLPRKQIFQACNQDVYLHDCLPPNFYFNASTRKLIPIWENCIFLVKAIEIVHVLAVYGRWPECNKNPGSIDLCSPVRQWPKFWLFVVQRGLYYPVVWGDYNKP